MTRADRGDPYSLNYWTNPVHKTGVEASAEFDGHDLFVKILAPMIYSLMSRIRRSLCGIVSVCLPIWRPAEHKHETF
jgi:hypothetical protein